MIYPCERCYMTFELLKDRSHFVSMFLKAKLRQEELMFFRGQWWSFLWPFPVLQHPSPHMGRCPLMELISLAV